MVVGFEVVGVDGGFCVGECGDEVLVVFQESLIFGCQCQVLCCMQYQFDVQVGFQCVQLLVYDCGCDVFGLGCCCQVVFVGDEDEGFYLFEFVYVWIVLVCECKVVGFVSDFCV